jgi:hypothetical protein
VGSQANFATEYSKRVLSTDGSVPTSVEGREPSEDRGLLDPYVAGKKNIASRFDEYAVTIQ